MQCGKPIAKTNFKLPSVALDLTFLRMIRGNAGRNVKSATPDADLHAEIGAIERGIAADIPRASLHDHGAVPQHVGALRKLETLHHVLLDQKDGNAFGIDVADQR